MTPTRRDMLAAGGGLLASVAFGDEPPKGANLGVLLYSYGIRSRAERGFSDPVRFLEFCAGRGANAAQLPLGVRAEAEATAVRRACDRLGMAVEGVVSPPKSDRADRDRFAAELATAKACGAAVVRVVLLGGRRYEVFATADDYAAFARRADEMLEAAVPLAEKAGVKLAIENHKDFRTDELLDLLKKRASDHLGVCVDTGNNLALLEDPHRAIEELAPLALTVHLKDMGVEESADGFRLAEVPLGQGLLDLKAVVAALRKGNPKVRFNLEMITRDPLSIPCLTDKYWATLGKVPGRDLARTLALVRRAARKEPLPRVTGLSAAEQVEAEDRNVRASFAFATQAALVPA